MNDSEQARVTVAARLRPRWKWTPAGLAVGALLILVARLQEPFGQIVLGLVGFTWLFLVCVTWLVVGPSPKPSGEATGRTALFPPSKGPSESFAATDAFVASEGAVERQTPIT